MLNGEVQFGNSEEKPRKKKVSRSIHWLKTSKLWHKPPFFFFTLHFGGSFPQLSFRLLLTSRTLYRPRQPNDTYWTDGNRLALLCSMMGVWLSGKQVLVCGQGPRLKCLLWGFNNYFLIGQLIPLPMSGAYHHPEARGYESQGFGCMKTWKLEKRTGEWRDSNLKPTSVSYLCVSPEGIKGFSPHFPLKQTNTVIPPKYWLPTVQRGHSRGWILGWKTQTEAGRVMRLNEVGRVSDRPWPLRLSKFEGSGGASHYLETLCPSKEAAVPIWLWPVFAMG